MSPPSTSPPSTSAKTRDSKTIPAPLSIPASSPSLPTATAHSAPLPIIPQRTASDPAITTPSSFSFPKPSLNRVSTEQPKSAGHVGKNVRFGFGRHAEDGDRVSRLAAKSVVGKKEGERHEKGPLRSHEYGRHHHETHVNVHTECGRHGDDWLFGGWNVGAVVKRVFSGGRKE